MKYIVYRTENKINGKFYYGVHNGSKPGYLGSGELLKKAIEKYGRENFVRRTIMEFDTAKEAYDFEALVVDQDFVDRDDCYNLKVGGFGGGFKGWKMPEEQKRALSDRNKKNGIIPPNQKGKKKSKQACENIANGKKGFKNPNSKPILDLETGIFYGSTAEAAEAKGINRNTLKSNLYHKKWHLTSMRYV